MTIQAIIVEDEWVAPKGSGYIQLKTGESVKLIAYHGYGRDNVQSVYACGDGPILGDARYCAVSESSAAKYGPEIEQLDITFTSPLVINDQNVLVNYWDSEQLPCKAAEFKAVAQGIRQHALDNKHDGIIVNVGTGERNLSGIGSKSISAMFGHSQVIDHFD